VVGAEANALLGELGLVSLQDPVNQVTLHPKTASRCVNRGTARFSE
jgi:hypothetical protein